MKNVVLSLIGLLMFVGCGCPGDDDYDDTCNSIVGIGEGIGDIFSDHSDDYGPCEEDYENFAFWEIHYEHTPVDSTIICWAD